MACTGVRRELASGGLKTPSWLQHFNALQLPWQATAPFVARVPRGQAKLEQSINGVAAEASDNTGAEMAAMREGNIAMVSSGSQQVVGSHFAATLAVIRRKNANGLSLTECVQTMANAFAFRPVPGGHVK